MDVFRSHSSLDKAAVEELAHYLAKQGLHGWLDKLTNITDLRHATEQATQNVELLQTAEESVRLERDRLNLILRSVPNPIILLDMDNQPILMNHEAIRLLQASLLDSHRSRRGQICISNQARFTAFVSQLLLDPAQSMTGEIVLTDPDTREQLTMAVTSTEVRGELGAAAATVSVMDETARLQLDSNRETSVGKLEPESA
jgi:PAS domain-containing protein